MQNIMTQAFQTAGVMIPENVFGFDYLKRMIIISMIFMGLIQGFLIFEISLLILKRLRFPVQRPKPLRDYAPPKWSGYLALAGFFVYLYTFGHNLENETLQNICQSAGICAYLYLFCFGLLAVCLMIKAYLTNSKLLAVLICLICTLFFPMPLTFLGFFYIVGSLRASLIEKLAAREKR